MNREVVFSPDSESEVRDAYVWYENRRPGLGADFLLCIEEVLDKVRRSPEQYTFVHRAVRRALIRRFSLRSILSLGGRDNRHLGSVSRKP